MEPRPDRPLVLGMQVGAHNVQTNYFGPGPPRHSDIFDLAALPADYRQLVGRDWLFAAIDGFLARHDRGYFFLEGDAGAGKTAFALEFARRDPRHAVHVTQSAAEARRRTDAVRNLVAQLAETWRLDESVTTPRGEESWLLAVLGAAAGRAAAAGTALVVVVDGLDEADEKQPHCLPFGLPSDLPPNAYVLATARTGGLAYLPRARYEVHNLGRHPDPDRADREAFLRAVLGSTDLAERVRRHGIEVPAFTADLLERCGDNWLYLRYVLDEILTEGRDPRDVRQLPRRLGDYYHNRVVEMAGGAPEGRVFRLLGALASVQEPMPAALLAAFAGIGDDGWAESFLDGPLRRFCSVPPGDGRRFAVKHPTFREFIADGTEAAAGPAESRRARLADAARDAQGRICDRYLHAALAADPAGAGPDGGYGVRRLAGHLVAAGRAGDLHELLTSESGGGNRWFAAHEAAADLAGYLRDVEIARGAAGAGGRLDAELVWYALLTAGVASFSTVLPPRVLRRLVTGERFPTWTATRAFTHIEQMTDRVAAARAVRELAPLLSAGTVPRAAELLPGCADTYLAANALIALIPRVPDDGWERVYSAWLRIDAASPYAGIPVTVALARATAPDRVRRVYRSAVLGGSRIPIVLDALAARNDPARALLRLDPVGNKYEKCQLLAAILPELPPSALDPAIAFLRAAPARYRTDALVALAGWAPAERLADVLAFAAESRDLSYVPPESWHRQPLSTILGSCAARLPDGPVPPELASVVLTLIAAQSGAVAAAALSAFGARLTAGQTRRGLRAVMGKGYIERLDVMRAVSAAAMALVREQRDGSALVQEYLDDFSFDRDPVAFAPVAEFLPDSLRGELAVTLARSARHPERAGLLRLVAPHLTEAQKQAAVDASFDPAAGTAEARLAALDALAPELPDGMLAAALARVSPGPVETEWFGAVAALAGRLPEDERRPVLRDALALTRTCGNDEQSAEALAALAPALDPELARDALEQALPERGFHARLKALEALAAALPPEALPRAAAEVAGMSLVNSSDLVRIPSLLRRLGREDPTGALRDHFGPPARHFDSDWLKALAPHLCPALAAEALDTARGLPRNAAIATLAALAAGLAPDRRPAVTREVLDLLGAAPDLPITEQAGALGGLAAAGWTDEVAQACRRFIAGGAIERSEFGDGQLTFLAHLPAEVAVAVLPRLWRRIPPYRYPGVRAIAVALPPRVRAETMARVEHDGEIASSYIDDTERARTLLALAGLTEPGPERTRIVAKVHDAAVRQGWSYAWADVFRELLPLLPVDGRSTAVEAAIRTAIRTTRRDSDLERLLPLVDSLRGDELDLVLRAAAGLRHAGHRAALVAAVMRRAGTLPAAERAACAGAAPGLLLVPGVGRAEMCAVIAGSAWRIHDDLGTAGVRDVMAAVDAARRWW